MQTISIYHNLATPVEHPSLAGLTHNVSQRSFVVKSCQISGTDLLSRSSFLHNSLLIVCTPMFPSCSFQETEWTAILGLYNLKWKCLTISSCNWQYQYGMKNEATKCISNNKKHEQFHFGLL